MALSLFSKGFMSVTLSKSQNEHYLISFQYFKFKISVVDLALSSLIVVSQSNSQSLAWFGNDKSK